jgi:hypothetical protein
MVDGAGTNALEPNGSFLESGMYNRRITFALAASATLFLAACGDPLSDVPRYSDVPVAETAGQVDAVAPPTPRAPVVVQAAPRQGLLGLLSGRAAAAKAQPPARAPAAPATMEPDGAVLDVAAAPPDVKPAVKKPKNGGLFGGPAPKSRAPRPGAPDAREIPFGVNLPYGEIARVCGVAKRKLGKKMEGYPKRASKYLVYDSAPATTRPRSFYLTGFDDGCARQFTAALVIFGSPESYEQIHYGPSGKTQPVSETDRAYEKVKSRVCKVRKGKPCGSRMKQLSRTTVFVSVYERFGSNPRWKNILLHDGEVVAMDIKN